MNRNTLHNLMIFRNINLDNIINKYINLYNLKNDNNEEFLSEYYSICSFLIHEGYDSICDYISQQILVDENLFSLSAESKKNIGEKLSKAVINDIEILKDIYKLPIESLMEKACDHNNFINYESKNKLNTIIKEHDAKEIYDYLKNDYEENSCGKFREYCAFGIDNDGQIIPAYNFNPVKMHEIYGYENQKDKIIKNTEKFLANRYALNVLLVGDSGTGKSTAVKSLIPMFSHKKLRLIEVEKDKICHIPTIVQDLKERGMYYIIFIDDLSFESNESSYKYLKSVVEGSIYEQPRNVLFYVTSNRKHLIKESMVDRDNEVHLRDAINEQTSLSDRFGLTILYGEPNQKEYFEIILNLAKRYNLRYSNEEEFLLEAKTYAIRNGGRNGRTAVQFIKSHM